MSEPTHDEWKRLIREHAAARGRAFSMDVLDELAAHIADVYAAEREAGRTPRDARDAAIAVLARGAYDEIAQRRRAGAAMDSTLIARTAPGRTSMWRDIGFDVRYALRGMRRQFGSASPWSRSLRSASERRQLRTPSSMRCCCVRFPIRIQRSSSC